MTAFIIQEFQNPKQGFRTSKPPNLISSCAARPSIPFVWKNRPLRGAGAHGRAGPPRHGCTSARSNSGQTVCLQTVSDFWLERRCTRIYWKIPAGRRFRDLELEQMYTRIYWKYRQADVLETLGSNKIHTDILKTTVRQTFWAFLFTKTDQKRNGVNEMGLSFGVNAKTSAWRWFWANPKPFFWSIFSSKIGAVFDWFLY